MMGNNKWCGGIEAERDFWKEKYLAADKKLYRLIEGFDSIMDLIPENPLKSRMEECLSEAKND